MAESQEGFPKAVATGLRDALTRNGEMGSKGGGEEMRETEREVCVSPVSRGGPQGTGLFP